MTTRNGGPIVGGMMSSISITMNPSTNVIVSGLVQAPCDTFGHRFAWLTYGGTECVRCGARG